MGYLSKRYAVMVGLLMFTVMLSGCAAVDDDGEELRIGSILPLTGDLDAYGPSAQNAVNLAVDHVNANGGVLDEDVTHVEANSESDEEAAPGAASELIDVEGVHGIVGAMGSGVSLSFIEQAVTAEVPMISPANTAPEFTEMSENSETDGWYFRTVPTDAVQAAVMADQVSDAGHLTASIIAINNDYGVGFGDAFEENFDGEVLSYVRYDPDGTDFSSDVEEATTPPPEAMVFVGYPDTGEQIMRNAYENGHAGDDSNIQWYFSEGVMDQSFIDGLHEDADEPFMNGYQGTNPQSMTADQFLEDYQDEFDGEPALFADRTYDAAMLLMLGAQSCECTSGEDYKEAIREVQNPPGEEVEYDVQQALELLRDGEDIEWTGAAGPLEFDENNDVLVPFQIWEVIDGQIEVIESDVQPE